MTATLDDVFHALADPTRRDMMVRLDGGPLPVGDLAEQYPHSLPAILKHLKVLERAGLTESMKRGRVRVVQAHPERLREAAAWVARYEKFWDTALDNFAQFVESDSD